MMDAAVPASSGFCRKRSVFPLAAMLIVASIALVGCSEQSPIYARIGSDGLEFLICELPSQPSKITVYAGPEFRSMVDVWSARGPGLEIPSIATIGTPPPGWETTSGPSSIDADDSYLQIVISSSKYVQEASFDLDQMEASRWMSRDAEFLDGECETQ